MGWPTIEEVNAASHEQMCSWWRFLPMAKSEEELAIVKRVDERLTELGGFTAEISKAIGWEGPTR